MQKIHHNVECCSVIFQDEQVRNYFCDTFTCFFHLKNKSNLQKHIFSVITHNASPEWFFLKADTTNPILFNWLFFNLNFSPWVCICLSSSSPLFLFFFPFLFPLVWCLSSWITHFLLRSLILSLSYTSGSGPESHKFCFLRTSILYFFFLHLPWQNNFLF